MQVHVIWIGKSGKNFVSAGIQTYVKRLNHYCKLKILEIQDVKHKSSFSSAILKKKEAEEFLSKIPEKSYLILLDEKGTQFSSRKLSDKLAHLQQHYTSDVCFLIGGSFGVDEALKKRADLILSFSKMTFSHQFIRVMLLEQVYRAFTILKGEKYHND